MTLTLIGLKDSSRSQKAMIAAELAGVPLHCSSFSPETDTKKPEFLEKSPLGRTPVLETANGPIVGSGAIARYIGRLRPDAGLYGRTFHERGQVDMWIEMAQNELEVPMSAWVYPVLGLCPMNEEATARAKSDVNVVLEVLDKHLIQNTFLVGERITLADVCVIAPLVEGYRTVFDAEIVKSYPAVFRWFHTCINQEAFKKVLGEAKMAKGKSEVQSSMNMDEWKRTYSNTKDLYGTAMKWFWENYDAAGYSLWYMKYDKLPDELKIAYIASNQLGGFLQRIEPNFRKVSFGVIDIVGEGGEFDIQGVWLFPGKEIPKDVVEHPSYEFHKYRKMDPTDPVDKKLIEDYWCADEMVENRPIADSKVWK